MAQRKREYVATEVVVTGKGEIPLDMLRYDRCVPATGHDVTEIVSGQANRTVVKVHLVRYSPEGSKATAARWESFGWKVVSDTGVG